MIPEEAYWHARDNHTDPGFDLDSYQEIVCKDAYFAYLFARDMPGANIEYCQKHVCKNPGYSIWFAKDIPDADIEYCRKACEHDEYWLDKFDKMIIEKTMQ